MLGNEHIGHIGEQRWLFQRFLDELSVVSSEALVRSVTLQGVVQHIYVSLFQKRERKTQDRLKSGIGKDLMKILRLKVPSGRSHRIGLKADGLGKISGS